MQITFFGQIGLPRLADWYHTSPESRATALARQLADGGHDVAVLATGGNGAVRQHHGVRVVYVRGFGWRARWREVRHLWRTEPDVIHVHGWQAAALMRLVVLLGLSSTLVWTIDSLPRQPRPFWFVRWLVHGFAAVTTPTRVLQYQLLEVYGLRVQYVPDGYRASQAPNVPAKQFGLVKGQFGLVVAGSPAAVRQTAQAYAVTRTHKRLVVLAEKKGAYARLARQWPFLVFIGAQGPRVIASLAAHSAVTIVADDSASVPVVLSLMDRGAVLIATTSPLYQETLGVTAQYFAPGDEKTLTQALRAVITDRTAQERWGRKSSRRVQRHFTWERVALEYALLYHAEKQLVPLDSARAIRLVQAA